MGGAKASMGLTWETLYTFRGIMFIHIVYMYAHIISQVHYLEKSIDTGSHVRLKEQKHITLFREKKRMSNVQEHRETKITFL